MDKEDQKKAIYEKLSFRRKKFIDRIGYDRWDPFQEPNHPFEIRRDITQKTAQELISEFLRYKQQSYSTAYARGVYEFCLGMFQADDRYRGMFDFCLWYAEQLRRQGKDPQDAWTR